MLPEVNFRTIDGFCIPSDGKNIFVVRRSVGEPREIFGRYLQRAEEQLAGLSVDLRVVLDGLITSRRTKYMSTRPST